MVYNLKRSIQIAGWNIDGLYKKINKSRINKLSCSDISSKLVDNDIVLLIETHCSDKDMVSFEGYTAHNHIRPKTPGAKKHYGGITVLVKNNIRKGITHMPANNSEYLWLKLSKTFFNLPYDIYLLVVYISPINSSFSGKAGNIFSLIEADIAKYSQKGKCMIYGDFNGRTNTEPDFCTNDATMSKFIKINEIEETDYPLLRNNCDKSSLDQNGTALLDLCKGSGVRILNGRIPGDSLGYHTCFSPNGNPSTIDYFLASPDLIENINFLHVDDPSEHSIHCLLKLNIQTDCFPILEPPTDQNLAYVPKYHWDTTAPARFSKMVAIHLNSLNHNPSEIDTTGQAINDYAQKLTSFYHDCARRAGLEKRQRQKCIGKTMKKVKSKPWFDSALANAKKDIKKYAKILRQNPYDRAIQQSFQAKKKIYKQSIKHAKRKFEQNIISRLTNIERTNPNEFWKKIQTIKGP